MAKFKAYIVRDKKNGGVESISHDFLMSGDVKIETLYSSFNFKDGLVISRNPSVVKRWPLIPGVDFSGHVINSSNPNYKKGDKVILNGWGVGENHHGGFSKYAKVNGKWLTPMPKKINERDSMIIGSAGYTSALCVKEIINKVKKSSLKPIIVTGASGGVGSISVYLLSKLGYKVVALSGKNVGLLKKLGAHKIIRRKDFEIKKKPLASQIWAGCIDTVGGDILSTIISETEYNGIVVSTGLAKSHHLNTTVYPFILRNLTLQGVECVYADNKRRSQAWDLLEELIESDLLKSIESEKNIDDLENLSKKILKGELIGRTLINLID